MLVPSEDSNMDKERLSRTPETAGLCAALSRCGWSLSAARGLNGNGMWDSLIKKVDAWIVGTVSTKRKALHLHFVIASDARCQHPARPMSTPDLNLLITLDVLLAEGHVTRAAQRLHLSPSAMSRALARLRETTGDPLLVRAGRGLVPTPRALQLRAQVSQLVQDAQAVLRPAEKLNLQQLARTFTLRVSDGFAENFGASLINRVSQEAPGVRLRFVQKLDKDSAPLRDGSIDLETGVIGDETGPEVRTRVLFHDRFVGVVRMGHALSQGEITPARYAAGAHVLVSRRGLDKGLMDEALQAFGLERVIGTFVGGFSAALAIARASDLIAAVPERHTGKLRADMFSFTLPVPVPEHGHGDLWRGHRQREAEHVSAQLAGVPLGHGGNQV